MKLRVLPQQQIKKATNRTNNNININKLYI